MKLQLEGIRNTSKELLEKVSSLQELEAIRIKFLGKKGELTLILRQMGSLLPEERPLMGSLANEIRQYIEAIIEKKASEIEKA